jgi:SAM-dependent methyltransferase
MTPVWLPHFVCPECEAPLEGGTREEQPCPRCARTFARHDGVWRFLDPQRRERLEPFVRQYRAVREQEGRRSVTSDYCRMLPAVPADDPNAGEWRVRQETYRHLLRGVLAAGKQPSAILDLGAGSGWLAHRLSTLGHHVVAVDVIEDDLDGLGAVRHYPTPIVAIHADFDALPLAPGQFDLVIFNGSLHYAADAGSTLARARQMLAPGGTLVVMDSPMFRAARDGAAMIADAVRRFTAQYGLREIVRQGAGFLTFASLAATARALDMHAEFIPSRGPLAWRLRRQLARLRLRREPASFGMWVAR